MAENDGKKLEYAVAWRDRYIRSLGDALAGREEEAELLTAFLGVLLGRLCTDGQETVISKSEVRSALGESSAEVEDTGDAYRVKLVPRAKNGEKKCGDADATEKDGDRQEN